MDVGRSAAAPLSAPPELQLQLHEFDDFWRLTHGL